MPARSAPVRIVWSVRNLKYTYTQLIRIPNKSPANGRPYFFVDATDNGAVGRDAGSWTEKDACWLCGAEACRSSTP